ncbi:MAG: ParB/RepB/Spo0J family partition protein [Paracoccaceae bacterium]
MAKRKRLILPVGDPSAVPPWVSPVAGTDTVLAPGTLAAPETKGFYPLGVAPAVSAPIARVAADAAATAALRDLADEVTRAREDGRLVQALPLAAVEEGWISRDRIGVDAEELASLVESLRAYGQRSPIEVVALPANGADPAEPHFGLISGWRRLTALRQLHAETGDARFGTVLALQRRPEGAGDAYVAMVEENEIRLGLSYYERARIAALAVEAGVFATPKAALQRLYASASRAKRSKIGSFLTLHASLDGALRFPAAIPERLGLALAARIDADPDFAPRLRARLQAAQTDSVQAEQTLLQRALKGKAAEVSDMEPRSEELAPGIRVSRGPQGSLRLEGPGVDDAFRARLMEWLRGGDQT